MFNPRELELKLGAAKDHEEGCVREKAGDYSEAEKLFRRAAGQYEQLGGPSDLTNLDSRRHLGNALYQQKKYDEAGKVLQDVVRRCEPVLGSKNPKIVSSKESLGRILLEQREYRQAALLFSQCAGAYEEKSGSKSSGALASNHWLGRALYSLDDYNQACIAFQYVVTHGETKRSDRLIGNLNNEFWLGCTLYQLARYAEAEVVLRQVINRHDNATGLKFGHSEFWLGKTLFQLAQYAEAKTFLRHATTHDKLLLHDPDRLWSQKWLGETLLELGEVSEAVKQLSEAVEGHRSLYGEAHEDYLESKACLDRALSGREKNGKAGSSDEQVRKKPQQEIGSEGLDAMYIANSVPDTPTGCTPSVSNDTRSDHFAQLTAFFLNRDIAKKRYTDDEINNISVLLRSGTPRWSTSPRTYIILRSINQLDLFNDLLHVGFSDYWLPATERSLPSILPNHTRASFVSTQQLVVTKSAYVEKGNHCHFASGETLPFMSTRVLGAGAFGLVDEVTSTDTSKCYARKRVLRSAVFHGPKRNYTQQFIAEIEILKRLRHHHIVELVGSYTDSKYIGLLMLPIASQDLSTYLRNFTATSHPELRSFFGCLASALEYLHTQKIRHKDIKPRNILIDNGNVLFVDFGLSLDYEDKDGSTTTGKNNGLTPRYCAPEVAALEPRNTMSDIWSLGVVFLEMVSALKGMTRDRMDSFFEAHGSRQRFVRTNSGALLEFRTELRKLGRPNDNRALAWIEQMLMVEQRDRPTAAWLRAWIQTDSEGGEEGGRFCGACCEPAEEFFSDWEEVGR